MDSLEQWEQRQQGKGRGTRPSARLRRQPEPRERPQSINVNLPGRSFGDWVIAGMGIGLGMILLYFLIAIPLLILWAIVGVAVLG